MSEMCDEKQIYPFYWLDETVEVTLNPARANLKKLPPELLVNIRERLPGEIATITTCLKQQAFFLYCSENVKVIAGHYDQAIRVLRNQAAANLNDYPRNGTLRQLGELILVSLAELSQCLYTRYPTYLPDPAQPTETGNAVQTGVASKFLCGLSADQLGILLRAATDAGVMADQSFRTVCKAAAPLLSTPWKKDIKADTLRSHAIRPERRDKEIAIALLETMIAKIKDYR